MKRRTLVITLGQLRAHDLTWDNFRTNVLDELHADLAVCVPCDSFFDFSNPFYLNARFCWLVPDQSDVGKTFDSIARILGAGKDWRVLFDVKGTFLGRIHHSNHFGAASILFVLRWFMLKHVQDEGLLDRYDRFVITRSDFYYLCPHPPLECLDADNLWLPDGQDWGGLTDRHLVVSADDLVASCNLIEDLLLDPVGMRAAMIDSAGWNIEKVLALHLRRRGLIGKVRRFPYIMFLVQGPNDPTAWSVGRHVPEVGMPVKYREELEEARHYEALIKTRNDWHSYFAHRRISEAMASRQDRVDWVNLRRASTAPEADITKDFAFLPFALDHCRRSEAQLFQDLWVLFESGCKRGGFFVEFGAMDGVEASNTFLLETHYEWSGIVAEPNPSFHQALRANRKCHVSTQCVAPVSNTTVPFIQTTDPLYSTIEHYVSSDMHAELRKDGNRITVETISLLDLLREGGAPHVIDYLSIDTEGNELEILQSFDFSLYEIRLISVEHNYTPRRQAIHALLTRHGYQRRFTELSKWDDWYVKRPAAS